MTIRYLGTNNVTGACGWYLTSGEVAFGPFRDFRSARTFADYIEHWGLRAFGGKPEESR